MAEHGVRSGKQNTFQVSDTAVVVRLELDPRGASAQDDRYTLSCSDDESIYSRALTVKDDAVAGDSFVTLRFEELPSDHSYSLKVEPGGGGEPYHLFENVPLDELLSDDFELEGSGAAEDEGDSSERPEGVAEDLPPTEDVVVWDVDEEDDTDGGGAGDGEDEAHEEEDGDEGEDEEEEGGEEGEEDSEDDDSEHEDGGSDEEEPETSEEDEEEPKEEDEGPEGEEEPEGEEAPEDDGEAKAEGDEELDDGR